MIKKKTIFALIVLHFSVSIVGQTKEWSLPALFFKNKSIAYDTLFNYPYNTENIKDTVNVTKFVAKILSENPELNVTVIGLSDTKESGKDSTLSYRRANKVKGFLIGEGIVENRIKVRGKANQNPFILDKAIKKASCADDKERLRRLNRRVVFILTK